MFDKDVFVKKMALHVQKELQKEEENQLFAGLNKLGSTYLLM